MCFLTVGEPTQAQREHVSTQTRPRLRLIRNQSHDLLAVGRQRKTTATQSHSRVTHRPGFIQVLLNSTSHSSSVPSLETRRHCTLSVSSLSVRRHHAKQSGISNRQCQLRTCCVFLRPAAGGLQCQCVACDIVSSSSLSGAMNQHDLEKIER